jgi:hypothetical protein
MRYTLITATGKLYTFYLLTVAETYLQVHGGVIVTNEILVDSIAQTAV